MTDKELHKMKRLDLSRLLMAQMEESSRLEAGLEKKDAELGELRGKNESLKGTLDSKDAYIEELKRDLDRMDAHLRELQAEKEAMHAERFIPVDEVGSIAAEAQKLQELFRAAQQEADQYINGGSKD